MREHEPDPDQIGTIHPTVGRRTEAGREMARYEYIRVMFLSRLHLFRMHRFNTFFD
jgi:hypothetical protein